MSSSQPNKGTPKSPKGFSFPPNISPWWQDGSDCGFRAEKLLPVAGTLTPFSLLHPIAVGIDMRTDHQDLEEKIGLLRELRHPNILKVEGLTSGDTLDGGEFIVVERVSAWLSDLTREQLDVGTAIGFFRDIAAALSYLHGAGLSHGGVIPEAVAIASDRQYTAKLLPNVTGLQPVSLELAQREDVRCLALCFLAALLAPRPVDSEVVARGLTTVCEQQLVLLGISFGLRQLVADCLRIDGLPAALSIVQRLDELEPQSPTYLRHCSEPVRGRARSFHFDSKPAKPASGLYQRRRKISIDSGCSTSDEFSCSSCSSIPSAFATPASSRGLSIESLAYGLDCFVPPLTTPISPRSSAVRVAPRESFSHSLAHSVNDVRIYAGDVHKDGSALSNAEDIKQQLRAVEAELALKSARCQFLENQLAESNAEKLLFACRVLNSFKQVEKLCNVDVTACSGVDLSIIAPKWQKMADLPVAVEFPCVCDWQNSLVIGGHSSATSSCALLRYKFNGCEWDTFPGLHEEWLRVSSVFTYNDNLHVVAETDIGSPATIFRFDEFAADVWQVVCSLPSAHALGAVAVLGKQLVVAGGLVQDTFTSAVDVYDFTTSQWVCWANMRTKRCLHSLFVLDDEKLAVAGGSTPLGTINDIDTIDKNNPNSWELFLQLLFSGSTVSRMCNLLVTCGGWQEVSPGVFGASDQCSVRLITSDNNQAPWLQLPSLGVPRAHAAMCISNNELYVIGGAIGMDDDNNKWDTAMERLIIGGNA